jgi:hypothetical protein
VTTDVKNGQDILLMDSNEIVAGRYVEAFGSVPAYVYPSRLSLQHEGGEVMFHGGTAWWPRISSGGVDSDRMQIRSTADLWPGSPNAPFVVGASSLNLGFDGNEIMARSNGAPSELHLNAEGGSVILHGHDAMPDSAKVVFYDNGRVRIGKSNASYSAQAKLSVDGLVVAEELRVTPEGWADYVFDPGYPMRSIEDLEAYVRRHRHLPGIPSEQSVMKDGLPLASFSTSLLRNVEELTLRVVEQSKTIEAERRAHEKQLTELRQRYDARLAKLEAKLDRITVK